MPKPLKWEYCECGCHGSDFRVGPLYYWMNDYGMKFSLLFTEHGGGANSSLGRFESIEKVNAAVRADAKAKLTKLQREIAEAMKSLEA